MMYKLLMRAFPGWYPANSVYALYPFGTPDRSRELFTEGHLPHKIELNYNTPAATPNPIVMTTWQGAVDLLSDQANFKVPCKSPQQPTRIRSKAFSNSAEQGVRTHSS